MMVLSFVGTDFVGVFANEAEAGRAALAQQTDLSNDVWTWTNDKITSVSLHYWVGFALGVYVYSPDNNNQNADHISPYNPKDCRYLEFINGFDDGLDDGMNWV